MSLPKLEDLIREKIDYNGYTLSYVNVSDALRLLEQCRQLQMELAQARATPNPTRDFVTECNEALDSKNKVIKQLATEVERLRNALEQYADRNRWAGVDHQVTWIRTEGPQRDQNYPGWRIAEEALRYE
jgi:chromosome segregation ATPase